MAFLDRTDAGRSLGRILVRYANNPDVMVLGLPRGGVPVAFEIARALRAPLDVFLVRKLGTPGQEELAFGAIAGDGVRVLNEDVVQALAITPEEVDAVTQREEEELARRDRLYRDHRPPPDVRSRRVILVDDGLATGCTMRAAVEALRRLGPAQIIVAVPVGAAETCRSIADVADEVVCSITPEPFFAVGAWYEDFSQTTDAEVRELLERAPGEHVQVQGA